MKPIKIPRHLVLATLVFALYWLAAQLGFVFSNHGILTPVWPAAAVGAAASILYGPRSLWMAAIYVAVDLIGGHYQEAAFLRRAWIEPLGLVVSAIAVRHVARSRAFDLRLNSLRQIGLLLGIAGAYASFNGLILTVGYCNALNIPSCTESGPVSYWWQSFIGDFFGCLIVLPALLSWALRLDPELQPAGPEGPGAAPPALKLDPAQWRFVVVGSVCIGIGWWAIHTVNFPVSAVGFLVLPILLWAALQFGTLFVHTTILVTGLTAISLQLTSGTVSFADPKVELTSLLLFLLSGSVLIMIVNVIVQQQQSMARALVYREEQERIELMLQVATDAILSFDARGRVTYLNPAADVALRREGVQLRGAAVASLLPDARFSDLERVGIVALMQAQPELFSGKVFELELKLDATDDRIVEVALTAYRKNAQWHGTAYIRDVTLRKRQEEDLKKTSRELETILQSTLVGIAHTIGRIHIWGNRKFSEMTFYQPRELVGHSSLMLFLDAGSWRKFDELSAPLLAAGQPFMTEWPIKRKDGSLLWCELQGNPIDPADLAKGAIWSFLDISERKRAEAELHRALAHQQELNDLRSRFVAMTSHEFRTPLATILSSQDLLKHYSDRLPPSEKQKVLDTIERGVHRMTHMLDRVLLLGKGEAHMLEFNPAQIDLRPLCRDLLAEAMAQHVGAKCVVLLDITNDPVEGWYDEKLLRHIFSNLLSNAVKYSPEGGQIRFKVHAQGDRTAFAVSDQGIGIPADEVGHLFESFHRASNVGSIAGTGLGLAIVKQSVELHGGQIDVQSVTGQGTTFTVLLPSRNSLAERNAENP